MLAKRKLSGGGDIAFDKYAGISGTTGVELVELLWIPRNKQPFFGTPSIVGYEIPVQEQMMVSFDSDGGTCTWISGSIKFYPDENGFCYGYVFLTETNKDLLASSLSTGWFRIIDKQVRKEIEDFAIEQGYSTKVNEITNVKLKKDPNEEITNKKLAKAQEEIEKLKAELRTKSKEADFLENEKKIINDQKLKGVKVKIPAENIPEQFKEDK